MLGLVVERGDGAEGESSADGATRQADERLLAELAAAFGDLGVGEEVGIIDAMVERGLEDQYEELCRLGARLVTALDGLPACGQRQCFLVLDLAGKVFRRVIEGDAACAGGYRLLALVYMSLGRWGEAVGVTREWELAFGDEGHSGFRDVLLVRGVAQVSGGLVPEAAFTLSRCAKLFPGSDDAVFALGVAYLCAGEREKCADVLAELSGMRSPLADALAELSRVPRVNYGDFVRAVRGAAGDGRLARLFGFEFGGCGRER